MSKSVVAASVVVVVFVAGGFLLLGTSSTQNKEGSSQESGKQNSARQILVACDVMSLDDARRAIGDDAEKPADASTANASSDDIEVTQCLYQTPAGDVASIKNQKQASLLTRSAKTDTGAESNQQVFEGGARPPGVQTVEGYGESAFWNPEFGQLNILQNDNWHVVQVGGSVPSDRTLDDAKKLADAVLADL